MPLYIEAPSPKDRFDKVFSYFKCPIKSNFELSSTLIPLPENNPPSSFNPSIEEPFGAAIINDAPKSLSSGNSFWNIKERSGVSLFDEE